MIEQAELGNVSTRVSAELHAMLGTVLEGETWRVNRRGPCSLQAGTGWQRMSDRGGETRKNARTGFCIVMAYAHTATFGDAEMTWWCRVKGKIDRARRPALGSKDL